MSSDRLMPDKSKNKSRLSTLFRLLACAGLIICLAHFLRGNDVYEAVSSLSLFGFVKSLLLFLLGAVPAAFVWKIMLEIMGCRISLWHSWRLSLIGFFWNNIVPGGVAGDAARVTALYNNQVPLAKSAASVFIERWSAFWALFAASLGAWFISAPIFAQASLPDYALKYFHDFNIAGVNAGMLSVIGTMAAVLIFGTVLIWSSGTLENLKYKLLGRFSLGTSIIEFNKELTAVKNKYYLFILACFINVLAPVFEAWAVYEIFKDLGGPSVSFEYFLVFIPIFRIILHLPISVNGIGTQEAVFALYWSLFNINAEYAVAVSILTHVIKLAMCIVGAVLYYWPVKENVCILEDSADSAS